jgi:hypothetical protein
VPAIGQRLEPGKGVVAELRPELLEVGILLLRSLLLALRIDPIARHASGHRTRARAPHGASRRALGGIAAEDQRAEQPPDRTRHRAGRGPFARHLPAGAGAGGRRNRADRDQRRRSGAPEDPTCAHRRASGDLEQ